MSVTDSSQINVHEIFWTKLSQNDLEWTSSKSLRLIPLLSQLLNVTSKLHTILRASKLDEWEVHSYKRIPPLSI